MLVPFRGNGLSFGDPSFSFGDPITSSKGGVPAGFICLRAYNGAIVRAYNGAPILVRKN